MTEVHLLVIYFFTTVLVLIHSVFALLKRRFLSITFLIPAFASSVLGSVSVFVISGHLPVSGDFEKYQHIVMFMLLISLLQHVIFSRKGFENSISGVFALLFLLLILPSEKSVSDDYLIYSRLDVVLFFQLRMLSIAFFSYAVSQYIHALFHAKHTEIYRESVRTARNLTLLGAAVFLCGEFFGSIWSLNGWGDPWRWSKSFFLAGSMFLLSMLAAHIPASYVKNRNVFVSLSAIPLIVIILSYIL